MVAQREEADVTDWVLDLVSHHQSSFFMGGIGGLFWNRSAKKRLFVIFFIHIFNVIFCV